MKRKPLLIVIFLLIAAAAACAPQTVEVTRVVTETVTEEIEVTRVVTETIEVEGEEVEVTRVVEVMTEEEMEPVTLRVMNWSQEQADFYEQVAAEFQNEYPHITVEWDTLEQGQYRETLPLMFQSGDSPDIFFWLGGDRVLTMAELLDQNWVAPMDNTVLPDDFYDRWPEGSFLEGINVVNSLPYSFPFNDNFVWGPGYMYTNKDVFRAAGLDPDVPPTTWSELRTTCETIAENTDAFCLAVPLGNDLQRTWYPLSGMNFTDSFFDYQQGRFNIDDERQLETFNYLQGFFNDGLVVPGNNDKDFARQSMANGQAAIYFGGAWMPSVFAGYEVPDLDLGVFPPVMPDDGRAGSLRQSFSENKFYISAQSTHRTEATLFLEWMTRPDGFFATEYLAQGFGTLPFSDMGQYVTDEGLLQVIDVANENNLRVAYPEPVVACADVAQSKAVSNANSLTRNWEFIAMSEALLNGEDFSGTAAEIAEAKNGEFLTTLEEEAAAGLMIGVECFAFPEWEDITQAYDSALYETHQMPASDDS
ncbi:MAG: extracellular solute-binding protein [Ardenticatenaceae bacterium]|nr:extracellular solute-binding protein [Ardenticatenaceae bacterium]